MSSHATEAGSRPGWRPFRFVTKLTSSAYSGCASSIKFDKEAISVPLPFCPGLRRRPLVAGGCTEECRRIHLKLAATCLNGVRQHAVSFAAPQQEAGGAGLPVGEAEGTRAAGSGSLPTFWQQKVGRLTGREPSSENNAGMRAKQDRKPSQPLAQCHQALPAINFRCINPAWD